jgi:hypothetical protein
MKQIKDDGSDTLKPLTKEERKQVKDVVEDKAFKGYETVFVCFVLLQLAQWLRQKLAREGLQRQRADLVRVLKARWRNYERK